MEKKKTAAWLLTVSVYLSWVQTEMGNAGAIAAGMTEAAVKLQDCIDGMTSVVRKACSNSLPSSALFSLFPQLTLRCPLD